MRVSSFYNSHLIETKLLLKTNKNKRNAITILRLVTFILIILSVYYSFKSGKGYYFIFIFLVGFLTTLWYAAIYEREMIYLLTKKKFLEEELSTKNLYADNGIDLVNSDHFYSTDIDLFGENSIFAKLNKTCTQGGRSKLTDKILSPSDSIVEIMECQEAVKELMEMPEWCIDFIATGRVLKEDIVSKDAIKDWLCTQNIFKNPQKVRNLIIGSRIINISTLLIIILFSLPFSILVLPFIVEIILLRYNAKKINILYSSIGNKADYLKKHLSLIAKVEERKFDSKLLQRFTAILITEKTAASIQINSLSKICTAFDNRNNVLASLLLNIIFLWDIDCAWKIENWKGFNKENFDSWIDTISEFDAIVSLSMFSFNHPNFVFPEIANEDVLLDLKGVAHPLINPEKNVANDFFVTRGNSIFLVTGANMAGKSTFLRTVAVNLVLAMIGTKVCAKQFSFSPMRLITSMRNMDSIEKNESFFLAELNRLKLILNYINEQKETLVIIDEPLRGTNSLDKTAGSILLIKKILSLKKDTCVLLATHDISLTEIANDYPESIIPKYFDIEIVDDQIIFDYKIKDGIASKMNAVELMKNMLIIE